MIAVLFTQDSEPTNYHFNAGVWGTLIGIITLFIVYKIDAIISKIIVKSSKYVFIINFFLSLFSTSLLFLILSWLLNIVLRDQWNLDYSFLRQQMILINFIVIITLSYLTISYFTKSISIKNKQLKADNLELNVALDKYLTRIPSLSNKKTILIPIAQILYFNIEEGVVFAYTKDNKKKPIAFTTLNQLEIKLNPTKFFRINRSEIVNFEKIESFEPYFKDRLAINILNENTTLYTSNTKSPSFRNWVLESSNL